MCVCMCASSGSDDLSVHHNTVATTANKKEGNKNNEKKHQTKLNNTPGDDYLSDFGSPQKRHRNPEKRHRCYEKFLQAYRDASCVLRHYFMTLLRPCSRADSSITS